MSASRGRIPESLRVLAYLLRSGGTITSDRAVRHLRVRKLDVRIRELERDGVRVRRLPFVKLTRHGRHVRDTTYHLVAVPPPLIDEVDGLLGGRTRPL
jgi:hypothetical protein